MQDRFKSLHANILSCLHQLQHCGATPASGTPSLGPLLRIAAAYVPYYTPADQVLGVLSSWPDRGADPGHDHGLHNGELGLHDYMVTEMAVQMHGISSVKGLLRYLHGVEPVLMCSEQWKADVSMVPLLRLQGELYSLALPGGPRCVVPGAVVARSVSRFSRDVRSMSSIACVLHGPRARGRYHCTGFGGRVFRIEKADSMMCTAGVPRCILTMVYFEYYRQCRRRYHAVVAPACLSEYWPKWVAMF